MRSTNALCLLCVPPGFPRTKRGKKRNGRWCFFVLSTSPSGAGVRRQETGLFVKVKKSHDDVGGGMGGWAEKDGVTWATTSRTRVHR